MKTLLATAVLSVAGVVSAHAFAQAYFTGNVTYTTGVTGVALTNCEYRYGNQTVWKSFKSPQVCPGTIEVY
jgi:hypothetical protein